MDKYHIPQHLNTPMKFFLLSIDELLMFGVPCIIGFFVLDEAIIGILLGVAGLLSIKRLKGEQGAVFLYALMYWHLPAMIRFKRTPPSHQQQWVG